MLAMLAMLVLVSLSLRLLGGYLFGQKLSAFVVFEMLLSLGHVVSRFFVAN